MVQNWIFVFSYYLFTEVLPSWLVFFILRTLPPREDPAARNLLSTQTDRSDDGGAHPDDPRQGKSTRSMADYGSLPS